MSRRQQQARYQKHHNAAVNQSYACPVVSRSTIYCPGVRGVQGASTTPVQIDLPPSECPFRLSWLIMIPLPCLLSHNIVEDIIEFDL